MNTISRESIQDKLYDIRDGVYIGKYDLFEAKPKLESVINELANTDEKGKQIADELKNYSLNYLNEFLNADNDNDKNGNTFCRSMNGALASIDFWVIC